MLLAFCTRQRPDFCDARQLTLCGFGEADIAQAPANKASRIFGQQAVSR
jgi:hypothetical protein